jgi:hypothetical protein
LRILPYYSRAHLAVHFYSKHLMMSLKCRENRLDIGSK